LQGQLQALERCGWLAVGFGQRLASFRLGTFVTG
jgi:hypothetical protein